jgi:hypothetical protein
VNPNVDTDEEAELAEYEAAMADYESRLALYEEEMAQIEAEIASIDDSPETAQHGGSNTHSDPDRLNQLRHRRSSLVRPERPQRGPRIIHRP